LAIRWFDSRRTVGSLAESQSRLRERYPDNANDNSPIDSVYKTRHRFLPLLMAGSIAHHPKRKRSSLMGDGRTVEAGAIGRREVVGINAFMGGRETTQTEYIVQLPGDALKIAADPLKTEFNRNTEMRDLMLKYTQAMIAQISQNTACNRLHDMEQRCARWLLEVRDRIDSDTFPLTQEFIAEMLGVRRAGVTETALALKEKNVIEYSRGHIEIADVQGLMDLSCECYVVLKDEYDRLLGIRP
jgi:CRP-like cAMP-binding protein